MAYGLQLVTPAAAPALSLAEARAHVRADGTDDDAELLALCYAAQAYVAAAADRTLAACVWRASYDRFPRGGAGGLDGTYGVVDWTAGPQQRLPPTDQALRSGLERWALRLPRGPLVAVQSVQYVDGSGALQTLDPAQYLASAAQLTGRLTPAFGVAWPVTRRQLDAVQVTFLAGHPVAPVALAVAAGGQTVTPSTTLGVVVGSVLTVIPAAAQATSEPREQVVVTAVTATSFTATFAAAHAAGWQVNNVPETLRQACRLLVGHWFENREAVGQAPAGPLAFAVDALLAADWSGEVG